MNEPVHSIIRRYSSGDLSAGEAAELLGNQATVADVLVMTRAAGLEPPLQPLEQAQAELARARAVLGLRPK